MREQIVYTSMCKLAGTRITMTMYGHAVSTQYTGPSGYNDVILCTGKVLYVRTYLQQTIWEFFGHFFILNAME